MELGFYKLHASANDFVLVNCMAAGAPDRSILPELSRILCRRKTGIGAAGILFAYPGTEARLHIVSLRADGEYSGNLGDQLLCLGRYAFDSAYFDGGHLFVETSAGMITIESIDSRNFRIPVGHPMSTSTGNEFRETPDGEYVDDVLVNGRHVPVIRVDLGIPLAVHITAERRPTLHLLDAAMRSSAGFGPSLPVFARLISRDRIRVTAWAGSTPDFCRIAAGAAVAVAAAGFCDRFVEVDLGNGTYYVEWDESKGSVYVTGNAEYSFSGTFYYDEETIGAATEP